MAVLNNGTNADIIATNIAGVCLPAAEEEFVHDDDGNLIQDGRWDYTWDAENRLIEMETRSIVPAGARKRLEFQYDYQGRRTWKKETDLDASTSTERKFVYDGWNLLVEIDQSNGLIRSYVWGLDLSESSQGAGGVGGLLAVRNADSSAHWVAYDGNGNVIALIDPETGQRSAEYEYGPFGELLRATGPMAQANPFRFSTKYADGASGFLYYGYRYYSPTLGKWLNRDPLAKKAA